MAERPLLQLRGLLLLLLRLLHTSSPSDTKAQNRTTAVQGSSGSGCERSILCWPPPLLPHSTLFSKEQATTQQTKKQQNSNTFFAAEASSSLDGSSSVSQVDNNNKTGVPLAVFPAQQTVPRPHARSSLPASPGLFSLRQGAPASAAAPTRHQHLPSIHLGRIGRIHAAIGLHAARLLGSSSSTASSTQDRPRRAFPDTSFHQPQQEEDAQQAVSSSKAAQARSSKAEAQASVCRRACFPRVPPSPTQHQRVPHLPPRAASGR